MMWLAVTVARMAVSFRNTKTNTPSRIWEGVGGKMTKVAKCPHCNVTLEEDDCIDIEDEISRLVKQLVGHCVDCGREYQWVEVYAYEGARPPVEIL